MNPKKKKPSDIIDEIRKKRDSLQDDIIDPTFDEHDEIFPEFRKGKADKKAKERFNIYKHGGHNRAVKTG